MAENVVFTFSQFKEVATDLATSVIRDDYKPTVILGLARGGLPMAVALSHALGVPLVAASYSSKSGKGDDRNHDNELPDLLGERILIVDDINDTGNTLVEVYNYYANENEVRSAVWVSKDNSAVVPTYSGVQVSADYPFVDFPWEFSRIPRD